jgi:hypothetical protein
MVVTAIITQFLSLDKAMEKRYFEAKIKNIFSEIKNGSKTGNK